MARDKVIEEWGALNARYAERNTPAINMQMQPKHGMTGKKVAKSAGELLERSGQPHIAGAGLATGRVSRRLRETPHEVRPSMRSQMLADAVETYETHDMAPGMKSVWHPEHIEDREVLGAGLPPLRASSRAGFMPGLGSVAMHNQEARAHEDRLIPIKRDHRAATRRLNSAIQRGDKEAIATHGATVNGLAGQMKNTTELVDHHRKQASEIATNKVNALKMIKGQSELDIGGHPSFGAAALSRHREFFDPETKEEFYPIASQHQLGDVAEVAGTTQAHATNLTAMSSAQRSWRRRDPATNEVSHPNLAMASHFAQHFNGLEQSGKLGKLEQRYRGTAERDIVAGRAKEAAAKDAKAPLKSGQPRGFDTEVLPEHVEQHVTDRLAHHVASTLPPPGGQMGISDSHARQMAKLMMAKSPEQMAGVWATTDADKRPTFALALAATNQNRSVRRQSAQANTVDTHGAKILGVPYHEVLGTGSGMHVSAKQELPHQPGKQAQPAYNVMAMYSSRAALQETAHRFKQGGQAGVSPRYFQENPWGLFAAENMADVQAARKNKAAGGSGQTRERASGYYSGQHGDEDVRSFKAPKKATPLNGKQFSDEELFS